MVDVCLSPQQKGKGESLLRRVEDTIRFDSAEYELMYIPDPDLDSMWPDNKLK